MIVHQIPDATSTFFVSKGSNLSIPLVVPGVCSDGREPTKMPSRYVARRVYPTCTAH